MTQMTTIKVPVEVRNSLRDLARGSDMTMGSFLEKIVAEELRRHRLARFADSVRSTPADVLDAWRRDLRLWDDTDLTTAPPA